MKKTVGKRLVAFGLASALVVSAITVPGKASAAKAVKKVTVNKKKVTLYPGADAGYGSIKLKATVKPKGVKVKWKSNKKKIATVNGKGLIKAKKAGKAVITAKAGKKSAKVKVTVKKIKKKVSKVNVMTSSLALNKDQTASIKANVEPAKATLKKLTYKSSDEKVASVSAKGVVKALQAGTATITVRAVDGSKKQAKVTVQVSDQIAPGVQSSTAPTTVPSQTPSAEPSQAPTEAPTQAPTEAPTQAPTEVPTQAPTEAPTQAPTEAPTQAPTEAPTQAPTEAPTQAPTEAPTQAPTEAPTQAPTEAPTQAPTEAPTQAPTEVPTQAPTEAPTQAPTTAPSDQPIVTADPDIPGNVKYTLDADSEYEAKVTVLGQEISLNTTDATADLADKAMGKVLSGLTEFYKDADSYMNKEIASKSYTVADGVTVTVSKEKGGATQWGNDPGNLAITLAGIGTDIDGTYNTKIYQDGDGVYNMTPNAKYYVEGNDWDKGNKFILRFAESTPVTDANGNQTITYDIDELSLKVGDREEVFAVGKTDSTDNIKVTVTSNAATGVEIITAERNGNKIVIKKDADGYSISIPEAYQEIYGIQIVAKAAQ